MLSLLPDYADPERLCGLGKVYEGSLALSELPRLSAMLVDDAGDTAFRLDFGMDGERRGVVSVSVRAELVVQCQRCLGSMVLPVESQARLAVVRGPDEAERLPEELDPLLLDGETVSLRSLIEDELILSVPNAPMHPTAQCAVDVQRVNEDAGHVPSVASEGSAGHRSPFAVLAELELKRDSNDE